MPFIPPHTNLVGSSDERARFIGISKAELQQRWKGAEGVSILRKLKEGRFSRETLEQRLGKLDGQLDMRGVPLSAENLSGLDLSLVDFFGADLKSSNLTRANLSHSYLSESNLCDADLSWIQIDQSTLWDSVEINQNTKLTGINTSQGNFVLAGLVMQRIQQQNLISHLERSYPWQAKFLRITCNYGESLGRWVSWCTLAVLLCSLTVWKLHLFTKSGDNTPPGLLEAAYFSIVTFTTLGYGDYIPKPGLGQFVVTVVALLGYVMFGILIAIIGRKVLR